MSPSYNFIRFKRRGSVLVVAMIFIVVFSALAVALASMSGVNTQIASNQQKMDSARASAESGMEVQRYWLAPVMMPSSTPPSAYLSNIIAYVQNDLADNSITNIVLHYDGSISAVSLDTLSGQSFSGQLSIEPNDLYTLNVYSSGGNGDISRTIRIGFDIEPYEHPIFNYGLATKGPLTYTGNPTISAVNEAWEADLYVESSGSSTAISTGGNSNFDGEIEIGNPSATVDFKGDVIIAGEHNQTAIDNHVHVGVDPVEFPTPDTDRFLPYAIGDEINSSTDLGSYTNILVNCSIAAGTNPVFPKSVIIQGVLFIESPNIVTFSQNVALEGIIVGDGDLTNPGTDRIDVLGNFASGPYPEGVEFDAIRDEDGSSVVAPGFAMSFQGNFSTLEGVVAVSGITFSGNVNAQIKGTIINYSDVPMVIEGNAVMNFDRVNSTKIPAGFDTHRVLTYNPSSYQELPN
ncbi:MAG: pilus assembly PilX N-terminal domain-containing protein [Sedimentisphaerales bacterium]|nr:pilus assembly PilX N-terminal domain-containing protein [Sedimentisphaerales bacterium]